MTIIKHDDTQNKIVEALMHNMELSLPKISFTKILNNLIVDCDTKDEHFKTHFLKKYSLITSYIVEISKQDFYSTPNEENERYLMYQATHTIYNFMYKDIKENLVSLIQSYDGLLPEQIKSRLLQLNSFI